MPTIKAVLLFLGCSSGVTGISDMISSPFDK
jgi:hypothetical protein